MKTLAISSGKGGVGKSNVAVNLGLALAQSGRRVLLLDGDLGLANIDILFGFVAQHTVAEVIDGARSIRDVVVDGPSGLKVLPAASGLLQLERLTHDQRLQLADHMQELANDFDLLIIDTGAGVSENVLFFTSSADDVLLVTTTEPTAMADSYAMVKMLNRSDYDGRVSLLVNQVANAAQAAEVHQKLASVGRRFLGLQLRYFGHLLYDPAVEQAVRQRRPVVLSHPKAEVSNGFRSLAAHFDASFPALKHGPCEGRFWNKWLQSQHEQRVAMRG